MFHLAIPAKDVDESVAFYKKIGCGIGRRYAGVAILDFFGHQVVLHQSDEVAPVAKMYPRHFGFIFSSYEAFSDSYTALDVPIWQEVMMRHQGKVGEHYTFFICDPSNNLIEFKYYTHETGV